MISKVITKDQYYEAADGTTTGGYFYSGLSTDTKPASAYDGCAFFEYDTQTVKFFNSTTGEWVGTA